jgi:hypothetical protein
MTQTEAPKRRILVINPSSSLAVTKAIDAAVHPLRIAGGPEVEVDCLREGPAGIATQRDADSVIMPMVEWEGAASGIECTNFISQTARRPRDIILEGSSVPISGEKLRISRSTGSTPQSSMRSAAFKGPIARARATGSAYPRSRSMARRTDR